MAERRLQSKLTDLENDHKKLNIVIFEDHEKLKQWFHHQFKIKTETVTADIQKSLTEFKEVINQMVKDQLKIPDHAQGSNDFKVIGDYINFIQEKNLENFNQTLTL